MNDGWRAHAKHSPAGLAAAVNVYEDRDGEEDFAWIPYRHLQLLNDRLMLVVERILSGEGDRLIVTMPPRHGKSELVSRYFPAWFLGSFPTLKIILASYGEDFAKSWGMKARDVLAEYGPEVFGVGVKGGGRAAQGEWYTEFNGPGQAGHMICAGAGGGITGKGAHLMVIDDPVKDAEAARSEVQREKVWDWWLGTASTRLQKGGAVVVVQTRWHEDDLAGRLLDPEKNEAADDWELLELPCIAQPDPDSGEDYDALGRESGTPLCPELGFDERWAEKKIREVGAYWWSALYQGRPRPADGLIFKRSQFHYWREHEDGVVLERDEGPELVGWGWLTYFQTADAAASEKQTSDYSVIATWAVTPKKDLLLMAIERQRFDLLDVDSFFANDFDAQVDLGRRPGFMGVEQAANALTVLQLLIDRGYPVRPLVPDVDKVARSLTAQSAYSNGKIFHPRASATFDATKLRRFEDELLAFPHGGNDDQVDVTSYAAIELPKVGPPSAPKRVEARAKRRQSPVVGLRNRAM